MTKMSAINYAIIYNKKYCKIYASAMVVFPQFFLLIRGGVSFSHNTVQQQIHNRDCCILSSVVQSTVLSNHSIDSIID